MPPISSECFLLGWCAGIALTTCVWVLIILIMKKGA